MKKIFFAIVFSSLLLTPVFEIAAQSSSSSSQVFDTSDFPQWAKDLRRWDIITFGSFPFSMFTVTFFTDIFRWYDYNGMSFTDLRYAPWPLKSAGAVEMTKEEYERTVLIAAGLSITLALTDYLIVKIKQGNERRRAEGRPTGSVNVNRVPYETQQEIINQEHYVEPDTETVITEPDIE